ncbi:YveK family protein [Cohnella yongneupensis]|uniref:YveK family protein n=1 Tax=Cohnella yongneupensis TaxID=425006 RepID=A0ABW0R497_9BACL
MKAEEMEFKDVLKILMKRFWIIAIVTIVITLSSAAYTLYMITPIYEAQTDLLVNHSSADSSVTTVRTSEEIDSSIKVIDTYRIVIKSPRILDLVVQKLDGTYTTDDLMNKVKVSPIDKSQVISIVVNDPKEANAVKISNALATTFQEEIVKIMKVDNVQVLAPAKSSANPVPVSPSLTMNVAIAMLLGIVVSAGIVLAYEAFDTRFKTVQDIENLLGVAVLGKVPRIEKSTIKKGERLFESQTSVSV